MADSLTRIDPNAPSEVARLELSQARARLQYAARSLKSDFSWLSAPAKVTASINRHPLLWVGGAFAVGAILGALSNGSSRRNNGSE